MAAIDRGSHWRGLIPDLQVGCLQTTGPAYPELGIFGADIIVPKHINGGPVTQTVIHFSGDIARLYSQTR